MRLLQPFVVLWHELGHALPALGLSTGPVELDLGRFDGPSRKAGRLWLRVTPGAVTGRTRYTPAQLGRWGRTAVVLGGPAASLVGVGFGLDAAWEAGSSVWLRFLALVFAWAHLRVLLFTCLPSRGGAGWSGSRRPGEESPSSIRGADLRDLREIWGRRLEP